jgi:predicted nucleic acid-binding protein
MSLPQVRPARASPRRLILAPLLLALLAALALAAERARLAAGAHELFAPVLAVTDEIFARALALPHGKIGAKDRIHVATCLEYGIDRIVTADRGFDTVTGLRRIDPREGTAPLLNDENDERE